MKIALINLSSTLTSDGSRLISALLKKAGHSVKTVFLARSEPHGYGPEEFEPLGEILQDSDLFMVAVYSNYALRAMQVTGYVRKKFPEMMVIWGGPHCISVPEVGLRYADVVCFSEGDEAVVDLVNRIETGKSYLDTQNMAFNFSGTHILNDVLPPFRDLDNLPYYDYELDDQFLLNRGLFQMTKDRFRARCAGYPYYAPTFYFLTSRGCPHMCSYCNNCRYVAMFGHNPVRLHSVDRVIEELEHTLEYLDFIDLIGFGDDDFFVRSGNELEDFSRKYKRKIGLPFGVAASANTYSREKMEMLLDAGLKFIQVGVQSGSQRTIDEVYNRKIKTAKTKEVVRQIEPYNKTHGLDFFVDFIIDNPYETKDDIIQTYRYLVDLAPHVRVNLFFLAFFPGTPIYDRALKDDIIMPFDEKAFRFFIKGDIKYQKNYETFLILLICRLRQYSVLQWNITRFVLRALGSQPVRSMACLFPRSFYDALIRAIK